MSMRLLPRDGYSWTGYIWLIYLASPIWYVTSGRAGGRPATILTAAAIALFLPLYFWAYRLVGARALLPVAAITAIAVGLSPLNPGGFVFFVYASSFAGRVGRPHLGVVLLAILVGIVALEILAVGLQLEAWAPAIALIVLVGGLSVVFSEINRAQVALRRAAQDDAQRLAVVAERERIRRDLHDLLGHTLTVIALKAQVAAKLLASDTARAQTEIREVERIAREALADVRRAIKGDRPPGLAEELSRSLDALETAGIQVESRVVLAPLGPAEEQTLSFAIREAVTNVIRHSSARRCTIRLDVDGTRARLQVEDNGVGGAAADGSGLIGMRHRVDQLGGQMTRDGRDGTCLTLTLPVSLSPS